LGDYQLISRISQNIDRMTLPGERVTANIAANYFSTAGTIARRLFGTNHIDTSKLKQQQSELASGASLESGASLDSTQPSDIMYGILRPNHTKEEKIQFQEAFFEEFENLSRTSSVVTSAGNYNQQRLLRYIDSIQVEID
jgi:hypothetical protein